MERFEQVNNTFTLVVQETCTWLWKMDKAGVWSEVGDVTVVTAQRGNED